MGVKTVADSATQTSGAKTAQARSACAAQALLGARTTKASKMRTPRTRGMLARTNMHTHLRKCARAALACVLSVCVVVSSSGVAWALDTNSTADSSASAGAGVPASSTSEHYSAGQSSVFTRDLQPSRGAQPIVPLNETGGGLRNLATKAHVSLLNR